MRTSSTTAAVVVTALTVLSLPPTASAQAAVASAGPGRAYVNGATGMCLAVGRGEVKAAKPVIQWPCTGGKEQRWIHRPDRRLVNVKTGLCLAIGRGEKKKGKVAIQWPCTDGGLAQQWIYNDDHLERLQNRATGMCLAIGSGEKRKGKKAIQWPCKFTSEQAWLER
ncbi:ricin-type beta-trefoil lectin protein [Nonomuraea polychroma]|uniref:Ricin-type beta-trefoil lectin protein n=1 Tax=Nonomuraea polychroma TaxID=46176 RepID=A0A438MJD5_9ACTN|nr:RICIN domain-containing protein [Nonomuraea polychroma]RVX45944.1 ricin-type beta-trefoil lectin protein [Nonomuraea polychroma]